MTVVYTKHAAERMFERGITTDHVEQVLRSPRVVEEYPARGGAPSWLLAGTTDGRTLMVVTTPGAHADQTIVITTYWPDPAKWDTGFTRRIAK